MAFTPTRKINGAAVRAIRNALGIRHMDLAARVGVTKGTLSHIESGARQAAPEKQVKFASALGVPLEAITYPVESATSAIPDAA